MLYPCHSEVCYNDVKVYVSYLVEPPQEDSHLNTNQLVTNGISHPYHLDESTLFLGASGGFFHSYFIFR